jgi:hypothetical protein
MPVYSPIVCQGGIPGVKVQEEEDNRGFRFRVALLSGSGEGIHRRGIAVFRRFRGGFGRLEGILGSSSCRAVRFAL